MQNLPAPDSQMILNIYTSVVKLEQITNSLMDTAKETKEDVKEIKREYKRKEEADLEYRNIDKRVTSLEGNWATLLDRERENARREGQDAVQTNDKIAATGTAINMHKIELNGKTIAVMTTALLLFISFFTWLLEQYLTHPH